MTIDYKVQDENKRRADQRTAESAAQQAQKVSAADENRRNVFWYTAPKTKIVSRHNSASSSSSSVTGKHIIYLIVGVGGLLFCFFIAAAVYLSMKGF